MMDNKKLIHLCNQCLEESKAVFASEWIQRYSGIATLATPITYVDLEKFTKWKANCLVLMKFLGSEAKPWENMIKSEYNNLKTNAIIMKGALSSILESIENGLLHKIEDLIFAEAFSNLLEQAEYLFSQGYYVATGVLCRAVIEEKLRNYSSQNNISINKINPTLNDYNSELYKAKLYDKILFKNIDHLTAIGNTAAHNQPLEKNDVDDLLKGTISLLGKLA
ncbi:DUF4145 domain-containing protein [Leptospira kmetyi]|uniref:DUF4145 domain-containing protein n=1 Tax=Leptospira kmetyi TaxID=408139 RepID=UPI001082CAAD|nr:DUF4145 domain-containing protein [Leptospira kmetyi]TGL69751.1 DUF4145 domain-containing protein [Leptospira kmetyi]